MYQIEDPLKHVKDRLQKMRTARKPYEEQWRLNQLQTEARSFEEGNKFYPNTKLEQAIIEMRLGGRSGDIVIDVEPDQHEPNQNDAIIGKHILYKFMHEEQFPVEQRRWRHDKAVLGEGAWWCGIRHEITCEIQREKIDVKPQIGNGFYDKAGKKKVYHENWLFMPTNIPLFSLFVDDNAINQPNFNRAVDCIICEYGSKEDILHRWGNIPGVNKDALDELMNITELDPEYGAASPDGQVTLYHYFNKLTKDWIIMGQEKAIIYQSEYEYACEGLPVVMCQHHPRHNSLYGMGEPEMISALKAAKNAGRQSVVDGTMLSSGKLILSGNSGEMTDSMDTQTRIYSGEVNFKDVTNSIADYKEIDTSVDLRPTFDLINLIDDEVRAATGIDVKAAFEVPEQNLGQTEIKEENKTIRLKAIDELEDYAIGEALTIALNNLIKFAPSLKKSKKEIDINGKITEFISDYTLKVPDISIKKGMVEEDLGAYGEIEFTEDMIKGYVKVRVTTASTNNNRLTVLEKNKVKEMADILMTITQIYGLQAVLEQVPLDWYWSIVRSAYGYGDKDTQVKSKKQQTKDKNAQKIKAIQEMAQSFTQLTQDASIPSQVQQPTQGAQPTAPAMPAL